MQEPWGGQFCRDQQLSAEADVQLAMPSGPASRGRVFSPGHLASKVPTEILHRKLLKRLLAFCYVINVVAQRGFALSSFACSQQWPAPDSDPHMQLSCRQQLKHQRWQKHQQIRQRQQRKQQQTRRQLKPLPYLPPTQGRQTQRLRSSSACIRLWIPVRLQSKSCRIV